MKDRLLQGYVPAINLRKPFKILRSGITILFIFCLVFGNGAHAQNFTNKGTEFWVGYGHNHLFTYATIDSNGNSVTNGQTMQLYLSAEEAAIVTVSINNTSWTRTYNIPAHTVLPSDLVPKAGAADCRILTEGLSDRAIHIVSNVPIVAFAHTYGLNSSGATMLLPVESYGYTYFSINSEQTFADNSYSWFYVVATDDNTKVRITPVRPSVGGLAQAVPIEVTLSKGQIYNIMGRIQSSGYSYDMSGSKIQSIPGADGKCHPIGVFSGSSRTGICQNLLAFMNSGSDFSMNQVFPVTAWGTRYIMAITASADGASVSNANRVRVYLRDKTTTVKVNGNVLTGLSNNFFYDYLATTSDIITANKPIMVAQFITSGYGCGSNGDGDPETLFISPVDQAIKSSYWYNTNLQNIEVNYVTLVIPTKGMASLKIDGSSTFDYTYPHPNAPGYTVVVKQLELAPMQHNAVSDSGFTAVTYGLGKVESYGYNAGTYIKNLEATVQVKNEYGALPGAVTCAGTNFGISLKTTYKPSGITWYLSKISGLSPNADTTILNPVPNDSITEGGRKYFFYFLPGNHSFAATGNYNIPVTVTDAQIENCSFSLNVNIPINVIAGPDADFSHPVVRCANDSLQFNGISSAVIAPAKWRWSFGDGSIDSVQQVNKLFPRPGNYNIRLQVIRAVDGCTGLVEKPVTINPLPIAAFKLKDPIICLPGGTAFFINESEAPTGTALKYQWDFGDNQTSSLQQPTHSYTPAGTYNAKLLVTVDSSGCRDSVTHIVNGFAQRPVAAFDPEAISACAETLITFNDISLSNSPVVSRQWYLDNRLFSNDKSPSQKFSPGGYDLKLIVTDKNGCTDTALKTWRVFSLPVVNAGADKFITRGNTVQLDGTVNDASATFFWSPGGTLSSTTVLKPTASPVTSQSYSLTATDKNHCSATDDVLIKVLAKLNVPNAFTPNGDGVNDTWLIPGLNDYVNATIEIFNRYGQKVFYSKGYATPWDGLFKGNPLPAGAYIYQLDTHTLSDGKLSGYVIILR